MIRLILERISNSQQTGISNNITETNNQTTKYISENYLGNNKNRNCSIESYTIP